MLKRLLIAIIALHGFLSHGQCDVAITNVNLETYEVTIEVLNSLGCTAGASPNIECLPIGPDAVIGGVEFEIGCIGDVPTYSLTYTVWNYGDSAITDYCVEIWNEDYYQCFTSDLFNGGFGNYEIPVGEGQQFTTPFFEYTGGSLFVISVGDVNDEIITGNNNTTVYYPDELEELVCPEECVSDTVEVITYIYQIDSIFTTIYELDTLYVELPPDTVVETVYEVDSIFIELPQDTVFENIYFYDTTYVEITDTILVDNYIYEYIYETDTLFLTEYVTDTVFITTVDTIIKYEYIVITDTVTEYIVQEIYIDCDTGLPCDEAPGFDCPDWTSIYIPNTFTPNNDGFNDVWKIILDLNCWYDVEFQIYNRWGNKIYHSYGDLFDSYPYWNGSIDDGDHYAADGVYTYIVKANKVGSAEVFQRHGHITIFR